MRRCSHINGRLRRDDCGNSADDDYRLADKLVGSHAPITV
jgi:hypothetical protein